MDAPTSMEMALSQSSATYLLAEPLPLSISLCHYTRALPHFQNEPQLSSPLVKSINTQDKLKGFALENLKIMLQ